jgi:hypothetical protein
MLTLQFSRLVQPTLRPPGERSALHAVLTAGRTLGICEVMRKPGLLSSLIPRMYYIPRNI